MLQFWDWIMNPVFSEEFIIKFSALGKLGILFLAFLKTAIIFLGILALAVPLFLIIIEILSNVLSPKEHQNTVPSQQAKIIEFPLNRVQTTKHKASK